MTHTPVFPTSGPDVAVPWHYGDPMGEQRRLAAGVGRVDLSHRDVLRLSGPDRLQLLHALTTQHLTQLQPGQGSTALVLSPHGHVEYGLCLLDDGDSTWLHTEPGAGQALATFLLSMRFMLSVDIVDCSDTHAIVWSAEAEGVPGAITRVGADSLAGSESFVARGELSDALGDERAGTWAYESRRIAAGIPRIGVDTDHKTLPNEIGLLQSAVHLDKGCYRGQETVARVHNLGRPPRRLVRLLLDGSVDALPAPGDLLHRGDQVVGWVGSAARHYELGPIALGLVKRSTPVDAELSTGEIAAGQEVLVDPEVGLHVRARP